MNSFSGIFIYSLTLEKVSPYCVVNIVIHIHLFQKRLSERTANGSCQTEIARPKRTVVSIFGMQKQ